MAAGVCTVIVVCGADGAAAGARGGMPGMAPAFVSDVAGGGKSLTIGGEASVGCGDDRGGIGAGDVIAPEGAAGMASGIIAADDEGAVTTGTDATAGTAAGEGTAAALGAPFQVKGSAVPEFFEGGVDGTILFTTSRGAGE